MRNKVLVLFLACTLLFSGILLAEGYTPAFDLKWSKAAADVTWMGASTERGIAYYDGKVYVASRGDGSYIRILDAFDGSMIDSIDASTLAGGALAFSGISVSDDGKIFTANLTTDASTSPFKVYMWDNDTDDTPETIVDWTGPAGVRMVDNLSVAGSVDSGTAVIYAATGTDPNMYRWTMESDGLGGFAFKTMPDTFALPDWNTTWGTPSFIAPTGPGSDAGFFAGGRSANYARSYTAANTTTGYFSYPPTSSNSVGISSINYQAYDGQEYLFSYRATDRICYVNAITAAGTSKWSNRTGTILASSEVMGTTTENTSGDVAVANNGDGSFTVFVLATNNGIYAYELWVAQPPNLFITELADPNNESYARFVEIYNNGDADVDLSTGWELLRWTNDNTYPQSPVALTGTITAGECYVVCADQTTFTSTYGFAADQEIGTEGPADSNGDDQIALLSPSGFIVDLFGVPGEDGSGTAHEFEDGRAVRKATVTTATDIWDADEWNIDNDSGGGNGPQDAPADFDPGVWPTIIPLDIVSAYSISLTEIMVKYTLDVTSVDVADYSFLGSNVTLVSAAIDTVDPTAVILTADADIIGDTVLDTLIDAANADSSIFYVGGTPISLVNECNPEGTIENGYTASFRGIISADDEFNNIWIHDAEGPYSAVMLFDYDLGDQVDVGDMVILTAERTEYYGLTELENPNLLVIESTGNTPYGPTEIAGSVIDTATVSDTITAEQWESQLVKIIDAEVISYSSGDYEYTCTDDGGATFFRVGDNVNYRLSDVTMEVGKLYDIIGVVDYAYGEYRINPRGSDDIIMANQPPNPFMILSPADSAEFTSLDDPGIEKIEMDGDSVKALFVNWTDADDPNGDTLTYSMMFIGDGPEDTLATIDTFMYIPLDEEKPYEMNGIYTYYFTATDPMGEMAMSDTHTITFDFPAPPMIEDAQIVMVDGTPTYYVEFDLPLDTAEVSNFMVIDTDAGTETAPTALEMVAANAVLLTVNLVEDHNTNLATSGLMAEGATIVVPDTSYGNRVLIPFSDAHPEDAALMIEGFETSVGDFSINTAASSGIDGSTTTFTSSDEEAFESSKSGKLIIKDDATTDGGWFARINYKYNGSYNSYTVKPNSVLIFLVKGTNSNVDLALNLRDGSGYERQLWQSVTLTGDDWQVVSFDLANDPVEAWVGGDGAINSETVNIAGLHFQNSVDEDVTLYIDGFTERQRLSPVDITLNVMMHEWLRQGKFNLATDFIDVSGSFNGWPGSPSDDLLSDYDGDTTYSVTVPLMPYSTQYFKFRIGGTWNDDLAEFPYGGPARELVVPAEAAEFTYWYNDDTLVVATDGIPTEFALHQNYPNPFNPTTTINFDLPEIADVKLVIYDITGRKIRTLVNNSSVAAGYKKIVWNGRDDFGNGVSTGMYIYRLQAGDYVDVKKMTFLK